jgi:hypothetical protein
MTISPVQRSGYRINRSLGRTKLHGPVIQPLTAVGEVTTRMLRLNAAERVIERRLLQALGRYRRE